MNRYPASTHNIPFVLAAVALTAATIALSVVLPAKIDFPVHEASAIAALRASSLPTEVDVIPSRVEVIGIRPQKTAFEPGHPAAAPKVKQTS